MFCSEKFASSNTTIRISAVLDLYVDNHKV